MVEYRPILSVNIVSRFQSSTFGHYYPTLQRGLSAIAELLVLAAFGCGRSLCDALREFRLQLANAGQDSSNFADTEFGIVISKLDRFFRLRSRRVAAAHDVNRRCLIRREFGSLLDSPGKPSDRISAASRASAHSEPKLVKTRI